MLLCLFACLKKRKIKMRYNCAWWNLFLRFFFLFHHLQFISYKLFFCESKKYLCFKFIIKKALSIFHFLVDFIFVTQCILITCKIKNRCLLIIVYCLHPHSIHFPRFQFYCGTKHKNLSWFSLLLCIKKYILQSIKNDLQFFVNHT